MQWKDNLTHFILAGVVVFCLTLLMVVVDAQARIAFASERDGNWQIYAMDNDGDNQRNLSNNDFDDQYPSWSPDGKHIAFVSEREGSRDIYVMDADGGIPKTSPRIAVMIGIPHGLQTVNTLPSCLRGLDMTGKST